jgi:hypothetical protein
LADPQKRCRSSNEEQQAQRQHQYQQQGLPQQQQQPQGPPQVIPTQPLAYEPSGKRRRDARYVAPRQVPKTFTSTMGSLAAGPAGRGNLRVHLRQQLSGSNLMAYLGSGGDAMDVEEDAARPRSMSL